MSIPTAFRLHVYSESTDIRDGFLSRYTTRVVFEDVEFYQITYKSETDKDIQLEFFTNYSVSPHAAIVIYDMSKADSASSVARFAADFQAKYGPKQVFIIGCRAENAVCKASDEVLDKFKHFSVTSNASQIENVVKSIATRLINELNSDQMKECKRITKVLIKHPSSFFFRKPINLNDVPDYLSYVKHPMDLGTVMRNLKECKYSSVSQWQNDVERIWKNCEQYNGKDSDFQIFYNEMKKIFIKECKIFDPLAKSTKDFPRPVKGVMLNGGRLIDSVKSMSTELDLSEKLNDIIPKSKHYSKKDLNPLLESDLEAISEKISSTQNEDERIHILNIFQHFNVPINETTSFYDIEAESIPSEVNIYLRSYFRNK